MIKGKAAIHAFVPRRVHECACLASIRTQHFELRSFSRALKGRSRTATFTVSDMDQAIAFQKRRALLYLVSFFFVSPPSCWLPAMVRSWQTHVQNKKVEMRSDYLGETDFFSFPGLLL